MARQYPIDHVSFLVAGSVSNRPTRIPRDRLLRLIDDTAALKSNNWLAIRCAEELKSGADPIEIHHSSQAILYGMHSPTFAPEDCPPLGVAAIGSGSSCVKYLETYAPFIMSADSDRAVDAFVDAVCGYLLETNERTVGGVLLMAHVVQGGVRSLCLSSGPASGVTVLRTDRGFEVLNERTGQRFSLRYPLEIIASEAQPLVFNDLLDALQEERDRMRWLRKEIAQRLRVRRVEPADDPKRS